MVRREARHRAKWRFVLSGRYYSNAWPLLTVVAAFVAMLIVQ